MMRGIADHLLKVAFDREADRRHRGIGGLVLERVLQMDGHFFDEEENGGYGHDDGYGHVSEEVDDGEGQQEEEEKQGKMDIETIGGWEDSVLDPFAFSHRV